MYKQRCHCNREGKTFQPAEITGERGNDQRFRGKRAVKYSSAYLKTAEPP